ncbi:DnaJ domain containing protein [Nitzschia inconspicua]|uniref:DnaJ domain containing protein n=1 Tax=Nitzschia inconspicua TaxID=303405 RepID=A0A9K3KDQ5_9STRA|nr:DnaJ domain containing protein [Nitzschia inconspicua]KAG7341289.1 DnaJ domain containing protein [Nitzschia inconspicua]
MNPWRILGVPRNASWETVKTAFTKLALEHHPDTATTTTRRATSNNNKSKNSTVATNHHKKCHDGSITNGNTDNGLNSSSSSFGSNDRFITIRQAFEMIRDGTYKEKKNKNTNTATPNNNNSNDTYDTYASQSNRRRNPRTSTKPQRPFDFSERAFLKYFFYQTGLNLSSVQRRELVSLHYKYHHHHNSNNTTETIPGGRYGGPSWEIARRLVAEQEVFLAQATTKEMHDALPKGWWWTTTTTTTNTAGEQQQGNHDTRDGEPDVSINVLRRRRKR